MTQKTRIDKERSRRAREALDRVGIPQTTLARALGVSVKLVNEIARGRIIGRRGKAHKVAVALGLKEGVILPEDATTQELIERLQAAAKEVA